MMNTYLPIRTVTRATLVAVGSLALSLPGLAAGLSQSIPSARAAVMQRTGARTRALPPALRPVFYRALAKDAGAAYAINKGGCATSAKQEIKACFDAHGAHFTGATAVSLHLAAFGRSGDLSPLRAVRPIIHGDQVNYEHRNLTVWWRALPMGFEQGFTVAKRPSGHGELTLALTASGEDAGAPEKDTLAWGKLRYGKLVVTDADGKLVPATLKSKGDRILIAVNDARAVYPLTVDPLVWIEQKVRGNDTMEYDEFGVSAALHGDKALIGALNGSVYEFSRLDGTWRRPPSLPRSVAMWRWLSRAP